MKLNAKERTINIRTQDAKIFIDKEFIKLSQIDLNLNILNYLKKVNSIKKIKITTDKNKIKKFTDFINAYKFSVPRLLIFNQIKDGNITAEININFNDKTASEFVFDVNLKVRDAKFNILNEYKVEEISTKGLKLSMSVKIENPNWFNIKAKGGEIDVKLGGNSLGKFSLIDEIILPKNSDGVVRVRIESIFKSLLDGGIIGIMSMLRSGGQTEIELKGYIKARALGLVKKIPISSKEKMRL